jgi:DNA/RNA-binding domain of Phe-tRNA-synthetase-like protein
VIRWDLTHGGPKLGVVEGVNVSCQESSSDLVELIQNWERDLRGNPGMYSELTRQAIRRVLKLGGFKPTGRSKPACEYLLGTALGEGMASINNLVDINNFISLKFAHPISIFDGDLLGEDIRFRLGNEDESYVFNQAGHAMSLKGIPVVCKAHEAVGNAVKDSMICKVHDQTKRVVACVYSSSEVEERLLVETCETMASYLQTFAGATETHCHYFPVT